MVSPARAADGASLAPGTVRTRVGVLALQGDSRPHAAAFTATGNPTCEVRSPEALAGLDALVLPGGESTTLLHLLGDLEAWQRQVRDLLARGGGLFATCAGLVLLARVVHPHQSSLALLDVEVERNAWGRQIDSFEVGLPFPGGPLAAVFIRAPRILGTGPEVEVLASVVTRPGETEPVLVRQGAILAATFHPELTPDHRLQRLFLASLAAATESRGAARARVAVEESAGSLYRARGE